MSETINFDSILEKISYDNSGEFILPANKPYYASPVDDTQIFSYITFNTDFTAEQKRDATHPDFPITLAQTGLGKNLLWSQIIIPSTNNTPRIIAYCLTSDLKKTQNAKKPKI